MKITGHTKKTHITQINNNFQRWRSKIGGLSIDIVNVNFKRRSSALQLNVDSII